MTDQHASKNVVILDEDRDVAELIQAVLIDEGFVVGAFEGGKRDQAVEARHERRRRRDVAEVHDEQARARQHQGGAGRSRESGQVLHVRQVRDDERVEPSALDVRPYARKAPADRFGTKRHACRAC